MQKQDDDEIVIWMDVLDEVMSGRTRSLRCPYCSTQGLEVEKTPANLSIKCTACGKYFSGRL